MVLQCTPPNRDWQHGQKCDRCKKEQLPCSVSELASKSSREQKKQSEAVPTLDRMVPTDESNLESIASLQG